MNDDYQRGLRQGRMMSRIERCVCTLDENGDGPIDVCAMHKAWAAKLVGEERERLVQARAKIEAASAHLDVEGAEMHDCDALLIRMQGAQVQMTLALNHLDRALANQSPPQQQ